MLQTVVDECSEPKHILEPLAFLVFNALPAVEWTSIIQTT